jgi:hypothetical protein
MRLLRRNENGEFTLAEFIGNSIPRYAILSHTWGSDSDEITFEDISNNAKALTRNMGYRKISFCMDQAAKDGLQYVWIDTCCIDKRSSAELSEAINSMFRWYQESSKCYVYLTDVATGNIIESEIAFQHSRWFTRGWTLQELVAPASVDFFSREGEKLGDKFSLLRNIIEITGIPAQALEGHPLSEFSVTERLSWATRRETKREEDAAYSLLGIFDVQMPLLYGEQRERAFIRLHRTIQESIEDQPSDLSLVPLALNAVTGAVSSTQPDHAGGSIIYIANNRVVDAQQRIFDSLQFSQIQERRHQIHEAYGDTYRWILDPTADRSQQWDDLAAWLSSSTEPRRIYWIYGKPGSGKSTLMRFLDENIGSDHILPWTVGKTPLRAEFFFWNPGSKLQKTLNGLLRTILLQLLEQQPLLVPKVVDRRKWSAALRPGKNSIEWTSTELKHSMCQFVQTVRNSATVFFLLDGLDELDGSDDVREELIGFLARLASCENVKICISSRPWNIFVDAFQDCPKLRLEDLTRNDINMYVEDRLYNHTRFQQIIRNNPEKARALVIGILERASGVFLWVCLVINRLLQGLRDGLGIEKLLESLQGISSDLSLYFNKLMSSISPHQRQEASMMLQIVLYEESEFATLHPLRLLDLCFMDEGRPDFTLTGKYRFGNFSLRDRDGLAFRLESVHRRLSSCCMGMIECSQPTYRHDGDLYVVHNLNVDFLHRSCRDFLSSTEIKEMLQQDTGGQYDARMFLLNSRVAQFMELATIWGPNERVLGLASYILCSLSRPSYRSTSVCVSLATTIQPTLEKLLQDQRGRLRSYWYIYDSIEKWHEEQSSFLELAIDFSLDAYVKKHMTSESILCKPGRPVLDYILQPRFSELSIDECISTPIPNVELVDLALRLGANPNQMYESASVWALFLSMLADFFAHPAKHGAIVPEFSDILGLMMRAGADTILPKSWLQQKTYAKARAWDLENSDFTKTPDEIFAHRWPGAVPIMSFNQDAGSETWYTVSNLLQHFRGDPGLDVKRLRKILYSREPKAV